MVKSLGTIRLIDKSLPSTNLMSHCTDKEIEISWNQAGQPGPPGPQGAKGEPGAPGTNGTNGTHGEDGVSVTTASEPAGANCAGGGVQLMAATGVNYVCNGGDGRDGTDGTNGTDGNDGEDGVSVTSAVEPAGSNCANGGSKFTAVNGVTYACNGAPGSAGSGGSAAGFTFNGNAVFFGLAFSPETTVGTLNLPAGKFLVFAKLQTYNQSENSSVTTTCYLRTGGSELDYGGAQLPKTVTSGGTSSAVIALMGSVELSSSASVTVGCFGSPQNVANVWTAKINAVKVDTLNGS